MENKKLILNFFYVGFLLILGLFAIYFYYLNQKLKEQVSYRDKLITKAKYRDSLNLIKSKASAEIINQYTNGNSLKINGNDVKLSTLLRGYNEALNKNVKSLNEYSKLQNELIDCYNERVKNINNVDSSGMYKTMFEFTQKKYGSNVFIKSSNGKRNIYSSFSKADSALLLYKYFSKKLKKDSISGKWLISK